MVDTTSLDLLASNKIIPFDANAYLRGTPARYVGNPPMNSGLPLDEDIGTANLNMGFGYGLGYPGFYGAYPNLIGAPAKDAFVRREGSEASEGHSSNFPWAKVATAGAVGGILILGAHKVKSLFSSKKDEAPKTGVKEPPKPEGKVEDKAGAAADVVETAANAGKKAEAVAETATETKASSKLEAAKSKFASVKDTVVKWVKTGYEKAKGASPKVRIAGGVAAGLCALYALYKAVTPSHKNYEYSEAPIYGPGSMYEQAPAPQAEHPPV